MRYRTTGGGSNYEATVTESQVGKRLVDQLLWGYHIVRGGCNNGEEACLFAERIIRPV